MLPEVVLAIPCGAGEVRRGGAAKAAGRAGQPGADHGNPFLKASGI